MLTRQGKAPRKVLQPLQGLGVARPKSRPRTLTEGMPGSAPATITSKTAVKARAGDVTSTINEAVKLMETGCPYGLQLLV